MSAQPQDRDLAILFSDVEASTELRSRKGDAAAGEILQIHETIVRGQLEKHGATSIVFLGDGFMAAFPDALDGVRAAIEIERALEEHNREDPDRQVRVRIGLHAGEVAQREGKLYGQVVHGASRVSSEAAGGQILVSPVVNDAWTEGETRDLGLFWLKGFPERWRLYEVDWRTDAPAAPAAPPGHAPMLEREAERAELRRAVDDPRSGRASLVLLAGYDEEAASFLPAIEEVLQLDSEWISFDSRWIRTRAGIAAAAAGRYDAAERYFDEVLHRHDERENRIEYADVHRFLARMLRRRHEDGDAERAEALLRTAIEHYRAIGMDRHAELAAAELQGDPVGATES